MSRRETAAHRATIGLAAFLAVAGVAWTVKGTASDVEIKQTTGTVTAVDADARRISVITGCGHALRGEATPSEFRTEPLMGLRLATSFLHDGRAKTIEEAVRLHGGEASRSRRRFEAMSAKQRESLLAFLRSL